MKNSNYRIGRNHTWVILIMPGLLLLLALSFTSMAYGQGRARRKTSTPAKKTGTSTEKKTPQPKASNTAQPGTANVPADTTKPGTVMSNQLGMEFAYIPSGSFVMGSDKGGADERPARRVAIRKG